jgi:hypothetical protein
VEFQTLDMLHSIDIEGGHDDEPVTIFPIQYFQVLPSKLIDWIGQDPAQNFRVFG